VLYAEKNNLSTDNKATVFLQEKGEIRLKELIAWDQGVDL